jgi:alkylation response protein AidB-like acyl-CoA dehydrogenase
MSKLLGLTLDYVKIRRQFGVTIGSFQTIQHRLVDMFAKLELSRPLAWLAVSIAAEPQGQQLVLSGAKAQISDACRLIREEAVQIHGGIGMTDEADCSHYFKRLLALEKKLGDRHHHLGVLAEALMAGEAGIYV